MNEATRLAIRAAVVIGEHIAVRGTQADTIRLPEHSWQQIQRLKRQTVLAHRARLASCQKNPVSQRGRLAAVLSV